ncbi:MAG: hypothetical protein M1840_002726 [Geoglossum simile]|nr:MAG: hypothetical protein M1840_002726 [Geoglossum simile]
MAPRLASDMAASFIQKYSPRLKEMHELLFRIDSDDIDVMGDLLLLVLQHFTVLLAEVAKRGGINREEFEKFHDGIKELLTDAELAKLPSETANIPHHDMIFIGTDITGLNKGADNLYQRFSSGDPHTGVEDLQLVYNKWYHDIIRYCGIDKLCIPE